MSTPVKGTCLCRGIEFEVSGATSPIGQCHCSKCRKVSGTDGNAVFYAPAAGFRWIRGEDLIKRFVVPDGKAWSSHFCGTCGSPVPLIDKERKFYFVPAGLLDGDIGQRGYAAHIFVNSKAPWVVISDSAPQYAEGFGSERLNQA
jgi:hypothetical protein